MGVVQEILKHDSDGSVKRHLFRAIKLGSYTLLLVLLLLLSGIAWRVFSGSEVEVMGLKVSNQSKDASSGPPKPNSLLAAGQPVSSQPAQSQPPSPPGPPPLSATPLATAPADIKISHAWTAMPHGEAQRCSQDVSEVMNILRLASIQTSAQSHWGTALKDGKAVANISIRCMEINGLTLAFMIATGLDATETGALIDRLSQEFNIKNKGVGFRMLGGSGRGIIVYNTYVQTSLEEAEQCRKIGSEAMTALNAANVNNTAGTSVFGVIDTSRVALQCVPGVQGITMVLNVVGFNESELGRIRDSISGRFASVKK